MCHLTLSRVLAAMLLAGGVATAAEQTITLHGDAGGKRFDGIGVVEGGGSTGVLLKDYPEPQRSQILDLVFRPKFGASVSALYVEIPGDGNSTQGSMPSHMHTRDDLNYARGYIWWEIDQAKKRNPRLSLDGAAWSAPGWLGERGERYAQSTGNYYQGDARFFSQDTVDYYISWLKGLRGVYGHEMEAIGIRNEKGASYAFAKALRRGLNQNGFAHVKLHGFDNWPDDWKFKFVADMQTDAELRDAIDIIGAHNNPPKSVTPRDVIEQAARLGKPLWNTEQHVYQAGFEGLLSTVAAFNDNHIRSGYTKIVDWYGIAGLYTMESYSGEKEALVRANWPWSGRYEVNPKLWAYAHYGQFSEIGWTYLHGGSGALQGGGSYVTLKSPSGDYSVIIETKGARAPQTIQLSARDGLSAAPLAVWHSDKTEQFIRQADLAASAGAARLTLAPDSVYSLTTTRGQHKGQFSDVPVHQPFPFPYAESFDAYRAPAQWGYLPRYFADIAGAFELAACPARPGLCLRQQAPVPTISWAPDWRPYSIIGDDQWRDYQVSADIYLDARETGGVMGRINHVGTGYGIIPKGYYLQLAGDGTLSLVVVRGKVDKRKPVGDAEQQALIKAAGDDGVGGEKTLASALVLDAAHGRWHRLTLRFQGERIEALVDGKAVLNVTDATYTHGMAGLLAGATASSLSRPYFDNFEIGAPGKAAAPATATPLRHLPIYPAGATDAP